MPGLQRNQRFSDSTGFVPEETFWGELSSVRSQRLLPPYRLEAVERKRAFFLLGSWSLFVRDAREIRGVT